MKDTILGQFRALAERYKIDVILGRAKPVEPVVLPFTFGGPPNAAAKVKVVLLKKRGRVL